ncbi:hypothetical protein M9H77_00386 [Catharanthus roseus]|nr:hypothetical protein M9H77_00386 [Catharanthus roseus]
MAKLAIAAVFLVGLLAIAQAYSFRTIVTTTVEEDSIDQAGSQQGQKEERCQEQIQQRSSQLQSCKNYLRQGMRMIEMYVNQEERKQQLQECCQGLHKVGRECSCQALNDVVQQTFQQQFGQQGQQGQHGQQQQQVKQMLQKARNIPTYCRLERRCEIQSPSSSYQEEEDK